MIQCRKTSNKYECISHSWGLYLSFALSCNIHFGREGTVQLAGDCYLLTRTNYLFISGLVDSCIIYCVILVAKECYKKENCVKLMGTCSKDIWKLSRNKFFIKNVFKFKYRDGLLGIMWENLFGSTHTGRVNGYLLHLMLWLIVCLMLLLLLVKLSKLAVFSIWCVQLHTHMPTHAPIVWHK